MEFSFEFRVYLDVDDGVVVVVVYGKLMEEKLEDWYKVLVVNFGILVFN